ncbi:Oidioi.mRNA.OKI2018_I69.chr1.g3028.t1.cds [Oikopleura dioica]|uniref:Oidioi.mRNA.OKI2018_I69.chr1.g3028.t1.cds n=1 Tax=Oikopleura dioica TaxID=34765 RepID=A0ABN7SZR7_OIKDI|nr:Oidioi.mRNA.OKI2018_I69.chr1.g3028.t1.cds [Oikopleura dioica]
MGSNLAPLDIFGIITGIWALIAIVGNLIVRSSWESSEVYRVCITMTCFCCWLHWLLCWMHQYQPLMGPTLSKEMVEIVSWTWENK